MAIKLTIALIISFLLLLLTSILFTSNPQGVVISKGYKCSRQTSYFWININNTRYNVNYDIWRLNEV